MKRNTLWTMPVVLILVAGAAYGDDILNTGPGPSVSGGYTIADLVQSLGVEFTLSQTTQLTDVEGWIGTYSAGNLQISIDGALGNVPNPASVFFQQNVFLPVQIFPTWQGLHGLNWVLAPGNYFAVFAGQPGGTYGGFMPTPAGPPFANDALSYSGSNFTWNAYNLGLGAHIQGAPVQSVPEPSFLILLATGGAGMVAAARRKGRQAKSFSQG